MTSVIIHRNGNVSAGPGRPTRWYVEPIEGWWGVWLCNADDPRYAEMDHAAPSLREIRAWLEALPAQELQQ